MSKRRIDWYFKKVTSPEVSSHNHEVVTSSDGEALHERANLPDLEVRNVLQKQSLIKTAKNVELLKLSVEAVKLCAFQGFAFYGVDEYFDPLNRGNFLELVNLGASSNKALASAVLENPAYTSPDAQKEILSIYTTKIRRYIREEISNRRFCIIVDVSQDEYSREQMAIILRFVDKRGVIQERLFDIVHVNDVGSSTLKKGICDSLYSHDLNISDIRGYGYDAASRVQEHLNGLQALILEECPYAHYAHCFAHPLDLILVAKSKSVLAIFSLFHNLSDLIKLLTYSSCEGHDLLQIVKAIRIVGSTSVDELETDEEKDQVGTLQYPCDMRWGFHLKSLQNLLCLYDSILSILDEVKYDGYPRLPGVSLHLINSGMVRFEFVFTLHYMIELLGRTDDLCRVLLHCKPQDIVIAVDAVSSAQEVLLNYKENGWDELLEMVKRFSFERNIEVPDMNAKRRRGRTEMAHTWEHYYRIEIFNGTIDCILQELSYRFGGRSLELLKLSSALDPTDGYKSFDIGVICNLAQKLYPDDFTDSEKHHMKHQLEVFQIDIRKSACLNVPTLAELCKVLSDTRKASDYHLLDRLIRLVLTVPARYERSLSIMETVRTRMQSELEDEFLCSTLLMNIEQEIARSFDDDAVIDECASRSQFT